MFKREPPILHSITDSKLALDFPILATSFDYQEWVKEVRRQQQRGDGGGDEAVTEAEAADAFRLSVNATQSPDGRSLAIKLTVPACEDSAAADDDVSLTLAEQLFLVQRPANELPAGLNDRPPVPYQLMRVGAPAPTVSADSSTTAAPQETVVSIMKQSPALLKSQRHSTAVAWSHDSQMLAYVEGAASLKRDDGGQVVRVITRQSGALLFNIHCGLRQVGEAKQRPGRSPNRVRGEGTDDDEKDREDMDVHDDAPPGDEDLSRQGHIVGLLFIQPRPMIDSVNPSHSLVTHELLVVWSSGLIRGYVIQHSGKLHSSSLERLYQTHIGVEEHITGNCIRYHHRFQVPNHERIDVVEYDTANLRLFVGGPGKHGVLLDGKHRHPCRSSDFSYWLLVSRAPYYEYPFLDDKVVDFSGKPPESTLWDRVMDCFNVGRKAPIGTKPAAQPHHDQNLRGMHLSPKQNLLLTYTKRTISLWDLSVKPMTQRDMTRFDLHQLLVRDISVRQLETLAGDARDTSIIETFWYFHDSLAVLLSNGSFMVVNLSNDDLTLLMDEVEVVNPMSVVARRSTYPKDFFWIQVTSKNAVARSRPGGMVVEIDENSRDDASKSVEQSDEQWTPKSMLMSVAASVWTNLIVRPIDLLNSTLLWHWETHPHQSSTAQSDLSIKVWQCSVCRFQESTPSDLLDAKMYAGDYGQALVVAKKYELPLDHVYKTRWLRSRVSSSLIRECLANIGDSDWVLEQCTSRMCRDAETQRALFEYGLRVSNFLDELSMKADGRDWNEKLHALKLSEQQLRKAHVRYRILSLMDRLQTYQQLCASGVDMVTVADSFKSFREVDLPSFARYLAQTEQFQGLSILFTRHGWMVLPHWLDVLSHIPETAALSEYAFLLPRVVDDTTTQKWPETPWRTQDWVECEAMAVQQLGIATATGYPPSAHSVSMWYKWRGDNIENNAMLLGGAYRFVKLAVGNGARGCTDLLAHLEFLYKFVYDEVLDEYDIDVVELPDIVVRLTWRQFEKLSVAERVKLLTARGEHVWESRQLAGVFVHDLKEHVVPYLQKVKETGALWVHLKLVSKRDLRLLAEVVDEGRQVFDQPTVLAFIECVLQACCACESHTQVSVVRRILGEIEDEYKAVKVPGHFLGKVNTYLKVVDALDDYPVRVTPLQVHTASEHKHLLAQLARLPSVEPKQFQSVKPMMDFVKILELVRGLAMPEMSKDDVQAPVWTAMLTGGSDRYFRVVRDAFFGATVNSGLINKSTLAQLILKASREYFDNAQSAQHELFALSRQVLEIVPRQAWSDSAFTDIKRELDFHSAVNEVCTVYGMCDKHGMPVLPIQVRLRPGEEVVLELLPKIYMKPAALLDFSARLLGELDAPARGRIWLAASAEARQRGDYQVAHTYCRALVEWALNGLLTQMHAQVSDECFALAKEEKFGDLEKRQALCADVLRLVPPVNMSGLTFEDVWVVYDELERRKFGDEIEPEDEVDPPSLINGMSSDPWPSDFYLQLKDISQYPEDGRHHLEERRKAIAKATQRLFSTQPTAKQLFWHGVCMSDAEWSDGVLLSAFNVHEVLDDLPQVRDERWLYFMCCVLAVVIVRDGVDVEQRPELFKYGLDDLITVAHEWAGREDDKHCKLFKEYCAQLKEVREERELKRLYTADVDVARLGDVAYRTEVVMKMVESKDLEQMKRALQLCKQTTLQERVLVERHWTHMLMHASEEVFVRHVKEVPLDGGARDWAFRNFHHPYVRRIVEMNQEFSEEVKMQVRVRGEVGKAVDVRQAVLARYGWVGREKQSVERAVETIGLFHDEKKLQLVLSQEFEQLEMLAEVPEEREFVGEKPELSPSAMRFAYARHHLKDLSKLTASVLDPMSPEHKQQFAQMVMQEFHRALPTLTRGGVHAYDVVMSHLDARFRQEIKLFRSVLGLGKSREIIAKLLKPDEGVVGMLDECIRDEVPVELVKSMWTYLPTRCGVPPLHQLIASAYVQTLSPQLLADYASPELFAHLKAMDLEPEKRLVVLQALAGYTEVSEVEQRTPKILMRARRTWPQIAHADILQRCMLGISTSNEAESLESIVIMYNMHLNATLECWPEVWQACASRHFYSALFLIHSLIKQSWPSDDRLVQMMFSREPTNQLIECECQHPLVLYLLVSRLDFSQLVNHSSTRTFLHDACHLISRSFFGLVISQLVPRVYVWDRDLAFMILTSITGSSARMFGRVSLVSAFVRRLIQAPVFQPPALVSADFLRSDADTQNLLTALLAMH